MDHYRLRKYRGPETWKRVREAYLAGETAPAIALRFDVGLANLRKKASLQGWTRAALAARTDLRPIRGERDVPPPTQSPTQSPSQPPATPLATPAPADTETWAADAALAPGAAPVEVLRRAVDRAGRLLAEGHAAQAATLIKAAQAFGALTGTRIPNPRADAAIERFMLASLGVNPDTARADGAYDPDEIMQRGWIDVD